MSSKDATSVEMLLQAFPAPRIAPFLSSADGDGALALELYAWNAQMSGAALEQISHLEVLLRNAIDAQLSISTSEKDRGIPWFLLPPYYDAQAEAIDRVRERLRPLGKETRDQVVAHLSFGFWSGWVGAKYEELWRKSLRFAFPNGSGQRKEVSGLVEQIRKFRNRIAHHDSLLNVDIGFEMEAVFTLASIISPDVAQWMKTVDRTKEVGIQKPVSASDTVIIPAREAWDFYGSSYAYICQAGRYFRDVKYMAFYAGREVKPSIAQVKGRYDNVVWNSREANRLLASKDREDRKLGEVMAKGIAAGWTHGKYQVFLLSRPEDSSHIHLENPLINPRRGKESAFVRKQKYTSIHHLRHANDVWDLQ